VLLDGALAAHDGVLHLSIRDDGIGGVDPGRGPGIAGLNDRVDARGGRIEIDSSSAAGTTIPY
jgi:signal transduction histidine kinase